MRPLVRISHTDHSMLRACDLNAELAAGDERHALHVRGIHRTWGVALGFEIEPGQDASEVSVGPGFGYDCRGRAIVSTSRRTVPLPSDRSLSELVVSATPKLRLDWREPGRACHDELVLSSPVHCRSRRFRLAAGTADVQLDEEIEVSTGGAGFRGEPVYFATLEAGASLEATLEVTDESTSGFSLVLRAPESQWPDSRYADARVHWTGVERLPACDVGDEEEEEPQR